MGGRDFDLDPDDPDADWAGDYANEITLKIPYFVKTSTGALEQYYDYTEWVNNGGGYNKGDDAPYMTLGFTSAMANNWDIYLEVEGYEDIQLNNYLSNGKGGDNYPEGDGIANLSGMPSDAARTNYNFSSRFAERIITSSQASTLRRVLPVRCASFGVVPPLPLVK